MKNEITTHQKTLRTYEFKIEGCKEEDIEEKYNEICETIKRVSEKTDSLQIIKMIMAKEAEIEILKQTIIDLEKQKGADS